MADNIDLSTLSYVAYTATALSNLVLYNPAKVIGIQPQARNGETQPKTFLFDVDGNQEITLQSDITDYATVDNQNFQNQIALRPEKYTVQGFIAELNNSLAFVSNLGSAAASAVNIAQIAASKLTVIDSFAPSLSEQALDIYNAAVYAAEVAKLAASAVNSISSWFTISDTSIQGLDSFDKKTVYSDGSVQNSQQKAFQQLYAYYRNRYLFTVQTPWAVYQNMAIETLRAVQDDRTKLVSDFTITFKRIQIASVEESNLLNSGYSVGRAAASSAGVTSNGVQSVSQSTTSFSSSLGNYSFN
jgi:hypothetical protein